MAYLKKRTKGQSALEYSLIIICLVAGLIAMQVYVKRGFQGRLRSVSDELGEQYSPTNTTGASTTNYSSTTITNVATKSEAELGADLNGDGLLSDNVFGTETMTTIPSSSPSVTTQQGSEHVGALETSLFSK
jgi:hypothetical protein